MQGKRIRCVEQKRLGVGSRSIVYVSVVVGVVSWIDEEWRIRIEIEYLILGQSMVRAHIHRAQQ